MFAHSLLESPRLWKESAATPWALGRQTSPGPIPASGFEAGARGAERCVSQPRPGEMLCDRKLDPLVHQGPSSVCPILPSPRPAGCVCVWRGDGVVRLQVLSVEEAGWASGGGMGGVAHSKQFFSPQFR